MLAVEELHWEFCTESRFGEHGRFGVEESWSVDGANFVASIFGFFGLDKGKMEGDSMGEQC